ncbi:MAG: 50S ribosomal protein L10 [Candidatus Liptonbacteria bacterium]|nr:50S ribosomal protein L10 [Candidatus Liptonbacteria bacterium]
MKSKSQKQEELKKGKELFDKSQLLVFTDFNNVKNEDIRRLRSELKKLGAQFLVIKKRLLNILLKEKGIDFDVRKFKVSMGTIFSSAGIEEIGAPIFKFFKELNLEKEKILGGYDIKSKSIIEPVKILTIGQLPSREVLLSQLLGMIAAPIKSLLYLMDQKAKTHSINSG